MLRTLALAALCAASSSGAPALDVVLSYYREDPVCVRNYMDSIRRWAPDARFFVYSKGDVHDFVTHRLDNVGREGDTYARHIVAQFGQLADHVIFSQACPTIRWGAGDGLTQEERALRAIDAEIRSLFHRSSGFINLGHAVPGSCEGDPPTHPMPRVRELHAMTHLYNLCPPSFWVPLAGQFLVSRSRVHRNPVAFYRFLVDMLNPPTNHFSMLDVELVAEGERERLGALQVGNNANYFLFQLERSWGIIFDCIRPLNETHNC
jgi:Protein of unknown function (DUF3431)